MTKTKDEIIREWHNEFVAGCDPMDAIEMLMSRDDFHAGASRMYDHRQKEIDEANRWWASRWQQLRRLTMIMEAYESNHIAAPLADEMDAAAAKVMEGGK